MWELRTKDHFGQIKRTFKEDCFAKETVFDAIKPGTIGWNDAGLTVNYAVEWLPEGNFEAFDKAQKPGYGCEPWELKNEYQTDSLGLAIQQMVLRVLDSASDLAVFYIEIEAPDGKGASTMTTLPSDTAWRIRNMVDKDSAKRIDSLENTVDSLQKELDTYKAFIKKYNSEKLFDDFRREMSE